MHTKLLVMLLLTIGGSTVTRGQHEDIPYQDVKSICETCICATAQDSHNQTHHQLNCVKLNFEHILARWPSQFGSDHTGVYMSAIFSANKIGILQQLPATEARLTFSCRHCGITKFQVPTFMDVPNIIRLDLSYNEITTDELTPDVFRGPYRDTHYEPIGIEDLDLSNNLLHSLDKKIFEHMPNLTKLNLSHNKFASLDVTTTMALASATGLKVLDLSFTNIKTIPAAVFQSLVNLHTLKLVGNQLTTVPADLNLIGKTLETLNLAGNQIMTLNELSFMGLKVLQRLNVSDMDSLRSIGQGTFTQLETLEYLYCSNNFYLETFDLDDLLHCTNLTELDISHCSINTLKLSMQLTATKAGSDAKNSTLPLPWPKMHIFETVGNPWQCDCELLKVLEFMGSPPQRSPTDTRCVTPYMLAGRSFSNITAEQICSMRIPKKYQAIDEEPPRFLRKRYIILTAITASVVIVLGLVIGFLVVCIRRRLKRDDFGIEPIRYTSVRSSNLSALSHVVPNGTNNA